MNRTLRSTSTFALVLAFVGGACSSGSGASSSGGGSGNSGGPQGFASLVDGKSLKDGASALAVDETYVYWLGALGVHAVAKGGGMPLDIATAVGARAIAVSADHLYWGDGKAIYAVPTAGGTPMPFIMTPAVDIALDATDLYWLGQGKTFIEAAPLATGVEHLLAYGAQPAAIAVDGTSVYWAEMGDGSVHRVPKDGGAAVTLAPGQAWAGGQPAIAAGGGKVFWTAGGPPTPGIDVVDAAGGSITTVSDPGNPSYLVADDASVYWGDHDGSIHRMGIADVVAVTLVDQASDGSAGVVAMALDNTSVYWATGDGSIRRTAK